MGKSESERGCTRGTEINERGSDALTAAASSSRTVVFQPRPCSASPVLHVPPSHPPSAGHPLHIPVSYLSHIPVSYLSHIPVSYLSHVPVSYLSHVPVSYLSHVPVHIPCHDPIPHPRCTCGVPSPRYALRRRPLPTCHTLSVCGMRVDGIPWPTGCAHRVWSIPVAYPPSPWPARHTCTQTKIHTPIQLKNTSPISAHWARLPTLAYPGPLCVRYAV